MGKLLAKDKPVVLTDRVCLIPGGEPVVRLEDAPGNARGASKTSATVVKQGEASVRLCEVRLRWILESGASSCEVAYPRPDLHGHLAGNGGKV